MSNDVLDPTRPWVVLLVDNSDSMSDHGRLVEDSINNLQREIGSEVNLGIARFSNAYRGLKVNSPNDYYYGGNTALYTSVVSLLQELGQTHGLGANNRVFIAVITDGEDNASQHRAPDVKAEVTVAESLLGWDFLYVGTNQAALEVGALMGVKVGKALSFANTSNGFEKMLAALADTVKRWLGNKIQHDRDFFKPEVQAEQAELGALV